MKYLCLLLLGILFINCKQKMNKDEHLQAILIYKVEELNHVNDSLQRELKYLQDNLEVCKSSYLEELKM
ncbi:hypothetical protein [Faecalibacter bovis]|uniref:Uncharacterized protein n=1 Tax=Faecalibacter bovis TaxID=2898187 RepID=A0ABX7XFL1_9FLAO|nr:hypothetical protein [Faecalibacter bovis]QTV06747.1 hypothetical protein J9309_05380 [Faecalibacter bovis]